MVLRVNGFLHQGLVDRDPVHHDVLIELLHHIHLPLGSVPIEDDVEGHIYPLLLQQLIDLWSK